MAFYRPGLPTVFDAEDLKILNTKYRVPDTDMRIHEFMRRRQVLHDAYLNFANVANKHPQYAHNYFAPYKYAVMNMLKAMFHDGPSKEELMKNPSIELHTVFGEDVPETNRLLSKIQPYVMIKLGDLPRDKRGVIQFDANNINLFFDLHKNLTAVLESPAVGAVRHVAAAEEWFNQHGNAMM